MAHNASMFPAPPGPGFLTAAILAGGGSSRLGGLDKQAIPCADGEPLGRRIAQCLARRWPSIIVVGNRPGLYDGLGAVTTPDLLPGAGVLSGLHAALSLSRTPWVYLVACDMPYFDASVPELLESRIAAAMANTDLDAGTLPAVAAPAGQVADAAAAAAAAAPAGQAGTAQACQGALVAAPAACLVRWGRHFEPFHGYWSRALLPKLESLIKTCIDRAAGFEGEGQVPSFRGLLAGEPAFFVPEEEARLSWPDWKPWRNINTPEELAAWRGQSLDWISRPPGGDSHRPDR